MNNLKRMAFYYTAGKILIPKPIYLIYNATLRCDLSCQHCGIWETKKLTELKPQELDLILNRRFFDQIETAWLTGGEPTLRKDFLELVKIFKIRLPRFRMLGIATNGYGSERILSLNQNLFSILDSNQQGVFWHISLDGVGKTFDEIRGKKGAFNELIKTVEGIKAEKQKPPKRKLDLGFNCVIQPMNVSELEEIKKFADAYQATLTFNLVEITDQYYCNQARAEKLNLSRDEKKEVSIFLKTLLANSPPAFNYQIKRIIAVLEKEKRDRRCLSFYSTLIINADGSWLPCPLSSGWIKVNFLETPPEKFWKSKSAQNLRKKVEKELCPKCALSCSLGDSLSFWEFIHGGFDG